MNLRQVEVFNAIMSTGSISDAARLLHVSVPAVSRVMSHTESRLGFPLFERVKGRLYPTAEAHQMYQEVELVYRGVKRLDRLTTELAGRRHSMVSIAASPSIGQMLVPLAIAYFRNGNPDVRVHFQCLNHEHLKERMLTGQVDVGVSILPMNHPNLETTPIARGRLVCVCPPKHPFAKKKQITVRDLHDQPLITYPRDTPFGLRIENLFAEYDDVPMTAMEVGSPQNACALVHAGAGIALVDEYSLLGWPMGDFMVVAVEDAPPIVADLVRLRTGSSSPASQAFTRALRSVLLERNLALLTQDA